MTRSRFGDGAVAGAAAVLCLQGRASIAAWMVAAAALPLARLCASAAERRRATAWLRAHWGALAAYPGEGRALPWRSAVLLAGLPLAILLLARDHPGVAGDTDPAVMEAVSLLLEGNAELSEFVAHDPPAGQLPYQLRRTARGIYSSYPSGMVVVALPFAVGGWLARAPLAGQEVRDRLQQLAAAAVAAAATSLFLLVALHLAPLAPAYATTAILGTGSTMFTTIGQGLWPHGGVVLGSMALLLIEFRRTQRAAATDAWIEGALCGFAFAARLTAALIVGPFLLWVAAREPRRAAKTAVIAALAFAPWASAYAATYATPLGPSTQMFAPEGWTPWSWPIALRGILISPGRGLLVYQPWIFLLLFFVSGRVRRDVSQLERGRHEPPGWRLFCGISALLYVPIIASWNGWWGGWCWGSRLFSEAIPLLALLGVEPIAALWRSAGGRRAVVAIGLVSALLHVPGTHLGSGDWNRAVDIDRNWPMLFRWSYPPFLYPLLGESPPG